jgi:hypothetical protein
MLKSARSKEISQTAMVTGSKTNKYRKSEQCKLRLVNISEAKRGK